MEATLNYNIHLRRIALSHRMSRTDIARCCALGGLEITASRSDGWKRSPSSERRFVSMTAEEFDAFTAGMPEWASENYG